MSSNDDYKPQPPRLREQDLAGKTAVVTGASKGIGRAIALHLASRGASVLGTYTSPKSAHLFDSLDHTVKDLYKSGPHQSRRPKMVGVAADLLSPECVDLIVNELEKQFNGRLNILVFNAAHIELTVVGSIEAEHVQRLLTGNIQLPVLLVDALVRRQMFNPQSRIINISSTIPRAYYSGLMMYSTCKAALEGLTRAWAQELGKRDGMQGTTVNAVSVGTVETPGFGALPQELQKTYTERAANASTVADRAGLSEDIADVVGFLASRDSRWVSGSVVSANGGTVSIM